MDRERAKELLPIITAFAEGKTIECRALAYNDSDWVEELPEWRDEFEYRIKPEPREWWIESVSDHKNRVCRRRVKDNACNPNGLWIKVREVLPTEVHELDINDD